MRMTPILLSTPWARAALPALALIAASAVCAPPAQGATRFALADPIDVVNDTTAIDPPAPEGWNRYYSFIDAYWLRPLDDALALHRTRSAADINSLEEVPASSWFRPG